MAETDSDTPENELYRGFAPFPTDCVICGEESETHEEHEQHMEEAHAC